MAIKTLRVFAEYTSTGFVPMPTAAGIDYGYTLANTFPSTQPSTFQTDDPDLDVTVTAMTDFYVWIRISGTAWNPSYTRNVRVYPDSPDINSVVMNMIIATGPAGVSSYSQIVQTANRLYFNGATTDSVYDSKFAGKTYINELNFGTAPQLATVATSGAYADLSGKPALATVATSGLYTDLSSKPSGTAPISYNSGTNSFQITQANSTTNGFLTSTDWNTFNNKYLLPSGGTTAQYLRGDGTLATFPTTLDSTRLILNGRNTTGTTLTKGTVVYINGVSGNTPLFARAIASADSTSAQTLGVVEFDIPNNSNGVVVLVGAVNNLDTSSYTEGVQLYLSGTTAGAFTSSKILAPTHLVYVGIVTRAHPTLGVIEVKIQNGYELDEIHDVQISSLADKHILYYDNATTLWKHAGVTSVLGFTPYNATNPNNYIARTALSASAPLSYNNTTGAFSIAQANGSTNGFLSSTDWTTFNNKQNALTIGNFTEVNSNVFMFPDGGTGKTIGNLSIQMIQAGASTNGYLSSTDWTTFNNKQSTITGGASTILTSNLTVSRALTSNSSGKVDISAVTTTELNYLSGVTSAIQAQLNAKQNTITNPVTGTGTTNYIPKFTGASAIGNSQIFDNGTNVGIGTTTPTAKLEVNVGLNSLKISGRDTYVDSTEDSTNANIYVTQTGVGDFGQLAGNLVLQARTQGTVYRDIIFAGGLANGNALMTILGEGNVGIGTSAPNSILEIAATTPVFRIQASNTASFHGIEFRAGAGFDAFIKQLPSTGEFRISSGRSVGWGGYMTFYTDTAERMRITSTGNVGIGTSSPTSLWAGTFMQISSDLLIGKLNVNGYSYLSHNVVYDNSSFKSINGGSGVLIGFSGADGFNIDLASGASSAGSTYPSYSTKFKITSGGKLLMSKDQVIGINTADGSDNGYLALSGADGDGHSRGAYIYLSGNERGSDPGMAVIGAGNVIGVGSVIAFRTGAGVEKMRIIGSGNVLIGSTSDNGYKLQVTGSIYATSNIVANSDLTLKKNLKLIENPIDKLMSLNGYSYQWKSDDSYQYGVIAQEVESVMSYAVSTGTNGIKGVSYNQLTPLLIEGFKLHNSEITQLKERVKYLEAKLA